MTYNTAYLDELVAEYLTYRGFFASLKAFKQDQKMDKSKSFNVDKIVDFLMQQVASGDLPLLRSTWAHLVSAVFSRLPDTMHTASAQRVEIALYKLYLVQAFQNGKKEKIQEFFQIMSSSLIGTSDNSAWKDWLAFPYLSQPSNQAPFAICFTRPWQDSVTISLTNLLMIAFNSLPKPRLILLMEQIAKMESDLTRIREGGKENRETALEVTPAAETPAVDSRPSRRLLSFFMSSKTTAPSANQNSMNDFRRTQSQSSFPRQPTQPLFGPGAYNRLSDMPTPEHPGEFDFSNRIGVESENDDTVVIGRKETNSNNINSSTSDSGAPDDAAYEMRDDGGDNESGNEVSDHQASSQGDGDTPKASRHDSLSHSISHSLPSTSFVEKVIDAFHPSKSQNYGESNKRNSLQHRKHSSTTKFTCLDTERVEVPGCHGTAVVRYSPDGRFLGVLSQSAQTIFIFSADSFASRGVVTSALVTSPPSCFCIGSLPQRLSGSDDDLANLLVAVGSSTSGRIYVLCHSDSSVRASKMTMTSSQLLLVPLEPGAATKQHSIVSVDVVPNQLDLAVAIVATTESPSQPNSYSSQIYVVSLSDLVVMRRVESHFNSPICCLCCLPCDSATASSPAMLTTSTTSGSGNNSTWIVASGDTYGSVYVAPFASNNHQQVITWQNIKLHLFSKIINLQPLPDGRLLASDATGRFAICRVDTSSLSLTVALQSDCDAFCSSEVTTWPSASPDGQFAAVLFDRGASLFLVNISSPDFGDIIAQLPAGSGTGKETGSGELRNPVKDSLDFTSVAWTPSVLQTAFTYVAALTKAGDLLVFRLLT